jgi:hypothetical protein
MFKTNYQQKKSFSNKPPRLMSVRYLEAELDALTSLIVRKQEPICFIIGCDKTASLECGHLLERRHRHTRWDVDPKGNCHSQCPLHNQMHEAKPEIYQNSFIERFGQQAFDDLVARSRSNQKITYTELLDLYEERKAMLAAKQQEVA